LHAGQRKSLGGSKTYYDNKNNFLQAILIFKFKMAQNSKNLRLNGHTSFEFQT